MNESPITLRSLEMQRTRTLIVVIAVLALTFALSISAQVKSGRCGLTLPVNNNDTVVLRGNVPNLAQPAYDYGATDPALPMEQMILALKLRPNKKAKLDHLLAMQQDPSSPKYHHWLTPRQFGKRFGPSRADLTVIIRWLKSQGFSIDQVANGRMWINFSGRVSNVERAFHTEIHNYLVKGIMRDANATDISIPRALAPVVAGVVSLNSFPLQPMNAGFHKLSAADAAAVAAKGGGIHPYWPGSANGTSGVYTSPTDWATIYDANASYTANGTGTGVTIGIVGRTNPGTSNWATFRSTLGLPVNTPVIIVNGTNPGDLGAGEDGEADLDAEWSGGTAPGATVKFVVSKSTSSTDGIDLSAQYIVNNNLADVMSTSFGQCESAMSSTENTFYNNLWSQAASQGITSCVSTGDSGPAGCAGGNASSGSGESGVNGLASTPYNIAVGATELSTSGSYWNASGAATSYIPETPWNESGTVSGGSGLWSTSSGASSTYAKPSWQVAPGVPSASHRYMPDVCLDGSDMFWGNYGMLVYTQGAMATTGGTSAASPSFAGVMALVVEKYGRQGNANVKLYTLGNAQYGGSGPAVFHDITSGNNDVPGLTGFTAATGWDEVTGLGTPDVDALVNNWSASSGSTYSISGTITLSGSGLSGVAVAAGSATATTNSAGAYTIAGLADGSYAVTPSKSGYSFSPTSLSVTVNGANVSGKNFTATASSGDVALTSGAGLNGTISGSSANASWNYYTINVPSGATNLTVTLTNLTNDADLYDSSTGTHPTTSTYTGRSWNSGTTSESLSQSNPAAGTWSIGVTNYATGSINYTVKATVTGGSGGTTYSISGTVSGATASGVAMSLSGAASGNATTDASGNYTFSGVPDGSYTVIPSKSGYTFTPASISVTISGANQTGKNFTATASGGDIALTNGVGLNGTISGSSANASWDYYTIAVPSGATNLSITLTNLTDDVDLYDSSTGTHPTTSTYTGRSWNSGTTSESLSHSNPAAGTWSIGVTNYATGSINYTITATVTGGGGGTTYSISGTVSGDTASGVTMTLSSDASATTTTNSSGNYTFSGLADGSYRVTPSKSGYTFSPSYHSVTISGASQTGKGFTATASGGDTALTSGVGLNGTISGSSANASWNYYTIDVPTGATNLSVTLTNLTGDADLYDSSTGTHPTTSTYTGRSWNSGTTSESLSHSNPAAGTWSIGVTNYAIGSINYTIKATVTGGSGGTTYSISGTITSGGGGLTGVTVTAGSESATTTSNGAYTISGLADGTYTVTPSMSGYGFTPASTSVTISGANRTGKNFTATASGGGVTEHIQDGDFESGDNGVQAATSGVAYGWNWTSTGSNNPISSTTNAYAGSWCAWLNGYNSTETDTVQQTVTIPAAATTATLSFYLKITTNETTTSSAYDKLKVSLIDGSGTSHTIATYSNLNASASYAHKSFNLLGYKGQTVKIKFYGTNDASLATNFFVDNVSLMAN